MYAYKYTMHLSMAFVNNALEVLTGKQCEKFRKPSANFQQITKTFKSPRNFISKLKPDYSYIKKSAHMFLFSFKYWPYLLFGFFIFFFLQYMPHYCATICIFR